MYGQAMLWSRRSLAPILVVCLAACGGAADAASPSSSASSAGGDTAEPAPPPVPAELAASAEAACAAARTWMTDAAARPLDASCALAPVYFSWSYEWDEDAAEHRPSLDGRLEPEALAVLDWDVRCMAARGITSIEATGMLWRHGSEEYDMALADRLARGVQDALAERGVAREAITTRSLGRELATGTDPIGWTRDVRVELAPR